MCRASRSGKRRDDGARSRVPDAIQHAVLLRRAGTRSGRMGPGSASHRFALRRARDTEASMTPSLRLRAGLVSIALLTACLGVWHLATRSTAPITAMSPEYAKLMGLTATQGKSAMPGPLDVGAKLWEHLRRPFYDNGPNDKGLGIQLGYSIARVALGYFLAVIVAIPIGFLIGMSPLFSRALD